MPRFYQKKRKIDDIHKFFSNYTPQYVVGKWLDRFQAVINRGKYRLNKEPGKIEILPGIDRTKN